MPSTISRVTRRLARLNPEGVKVQASFVEGGGHADGLSEIRPGDVVDAVLEGAVRAHIVNHAFRSDDDAVAALLNPLDMLIQAVVRQHLTVSLDAAGLPQAAQVW